MYKLIHDTPFGKSNVVLKINDNAFIPFDPANTDYAKFKDAVNAGKAQLQDADGVLMSPEAAKAYVATLP